MALYTDNGNNYPQTLLASTANDNGFEGTQELAVSTPVAIAAGNYWLLSVFSTTTSMPYASVAGQVMAYTKPGMPAPATFPAPSGTQTGSATFGYA